MASVVHLAGRFFGAVKPGPPSAADETWATSRLLPGETRIWASMNNPDRRHAVTVARAVVAATEGPVADPVVAAALLHDCGKVVSGFRTPARVAATLLWAVADDRTADRWITDYQTGLRLRFAQYRRHPELGQQMLEEAGSDPLTSRWAGEHHRPEADWSVPVDIGRVLKDCDDD